MTKEQLKELVTSEEITLFKVIDLVVEINGIIGVGLYRLADEVKNYIESGEKQEYD